MKRLGVILLLSGIFVACEKEDYSSIPYAHVNYELYPKDADELFSRFILIVDKIRNQKDLIGYEGLLITQSIDRPHVYYAFDLACPTEARRGIHIKPDESGLSATCAQCGARFNIATGGDVYGFGNCENGVTRYTLKSYQVITQSTAIGVRAHRVVN